MTQGQKWFSAKISALFLGVHRVMILLVSKRQRDIVFLLLIQARTIVKPTCSRKSAFLVRLAVSATHLLASIIRHVIKQKFRRILKLQIKFLLGKLQQTKTLQ